MAWVKENVLMRGHAGRIGTDVVFKIINGETFSGKYPDRSKVKYSKEQLKVKKIFADAAKFASDIVNDPARRAAYKRKGRISVYHSALADFMTANSPENPLKSKIDISVYLKHPSLNERQKKAIKYLAKRKNITNAIYQKLNTISKPTATRDLQSLVKFKIFNPPVTRGAGAIYTFKTPKPAKIDK
jgi:predicted HTH transcriptional regulator